jgi:hypothetical protein
MEMYRLLRGAGLDGHPDKGKPAEIRPQSVPGGYPSGSGVGAGGAGKGAGPAGGGEPDRFAAQSPAQQRAHGIGACH